MSESYQQHDRHYLAVDNIIFGYDQKVLKILLIKRKFEPELGNWSLMGGFVQTGESLDRAAARVVKELTGLEGVFMEQVKTYGAVDRDSEARTVSVSYYTLIQADLYDAELGKRKGAAWFPADNFPDLIFDHRDMVAHALDALRHKTRIQPIGFELLPEKFTLPQLRSLYEAIHHKELDPGNFSKKMKKMRLLIQLEEKDKSESRKGAFYFRFDYERYESLLAQGFHFDLQGFFKHSPVPEN